MKLIFVHGWSVTSTQTYGGLPEALSNAAATYGLSLDIEHLYLSRYISFHDELTLDDISRAMDRALRDLPGNSATSIQTFSCITHSTGGPIVRHWIDRFYGARSLKALPLKHLVMLAPANHGSALAALGKARVGRLKAWFQGVEPGQKVLDWLCLGSDGQWELNTNSLSYNYALSALYPFVLTGNTHEEKFYDFLNSYLVEPGSDGVIRIAGANMNYCYISLVQDRTEIIRQKPPTCALKQVGAVKKSKPVPLGVFDCYSHTGKNKGIMESIKPDDIQAPVVTGILKCLQVHNANDYRARFNELAEQTEQQQSGTERYCMLVFDIHDDEGHRIKKEDYDLFLLAGKKHQPQQLPAGFFQDKQMNKKTSRLVYYLDADRMGAIQDGAFGIRVVARPSTGFSCYQAAEYHTNDITLSHLIAPNQTTYIDIQLHRFVDKNVFRFDSASNPRQNFKKIKPSGKSINNT